MAKSVNGILFPQETKFKLTTTARTLPWCFPNTYNKGCYRLLNQGRQWRWCGNGMNEIVSVRGGQLQGAAAGLPEILLRAGGNAGFAAEEFFKATINNPTRSALTAAQWRGAGVRLNGVHRGFQWLCQKHQLRRIAPRAKGGSIAAHLAPGSRSGFPVIALRCRHCPTS